LTCPPKQGKTHHNKHPRHDVEEAVPNCIYLKTSDGIRGVAPGTCKQVVPLQNLVQKDAIKEASEPYTENQARQQ
jgi:hypothetical protein